MADPFQTTPVEDCLDSRTDADLLRGVARQEEAALAALFQRFGGRIFAYVRTLGGRGFPAEDAVQEVFLTLWQKAALFSPGGGSAEAWIFTVTRHKVFDSLRARRSTKEVADLDLERWPGPEVDPGSEIEDAISLHKALSLLPTEQQGPIRLAYMGGFTYEEAAHQLGLPLGTMKSRIRSGLVALREHLTSSRPEGPS